MSQKNKSLDFAHSHGVLLSDRKEGLGDAGNKFQASPSLACIDAFDAKAYDVVYLKEMSFLVIENIFEIRGKT